jgi:4-amino-4-deoxy-L-arabinose transferase-like glycosyltransferase
MDAPAWARQITSAVSCVRPSALKLPPMEPVDAPYGGDPAGYLRYARDMERFYDAHLREPLFVFATKIALVLSGGTDVAVSLTAAVFSTLMVWGTYLVGSLAFGRRVGLMAAFLLAIERSVIATGADGWRDDAFAFVVLLSAFTLARLSRDPSFKNAVWVGLAGGAACLTRITSLSFFLPALLLSCFWGDPPARRRRLEAAAVSLLIAAILVGPYLASCAIALGDPFVSINAHTQFYRSRAGLPEDQPMNWLQYLSVSFHPAELARNLLVGLTTFPFNNKWLAFNLWLPRSSSVLRLLSLVGMLLFLRTREGRLLLLILFSALVPFAFTWGLVGGDDLRFTLHAYPFYLLAAAYAFDGVLSRLGRLASGHATPAST